MRILLTGSGGYVGSHLLPALRGEQVVAIQRERPNMSPADAEFVAADLGDDETYRRLPANIDAVVHLAQSNAYRSFPEGVIDMTRVNIMATVRLLEYARNAGARVFVFASSGSVYEPYCGSIEELSAIAPTSFYSASKASAEMLMRPYQAYFRTVALRIFFPYGPAQQNKLIPSLIERIRQGDPVDLVGADHGMVICPTWIGDLVEGIRAACHDDRWTGSVNFANVESLTLRQIATAIGERVGREALFRHVEGNAVEVIPNLTRLRSLVDISRFRDFKSGIDALFDGGS